MQCVFNACFLFLHLDFSCCAYLDNRNTARELGNTFLQLLFVVIGRRILDFVVDLLNTALNIFAAACAVDDGRVFLGDLNLLGFTQIVQRRLLQ